MRASLTKPLAGIVLVILLTTTGCGLMGLPNTDSLENLQLISATQVYDVNGQLISKLFEENRVVVTINNISPYVQQAVIANEDSRFYSHFGIDPIGILRALVVNIRTGSLAEGGSTLTQQLAKNMFLTQERTFTRKIKEAILAIVIERKFSKQEILQAYLNQVYFGEGAYGVEAAAQVYFGKHASDLSLSESALISGLPRGPNIYSPYIDMKAAVERRDTVLDGMVKENYITKEQARTARQEGVTLAGKKKRMVQASYFLDYIAKELVGRYGANRVYKGGLKVYTTLDSKTQQAAEAVLGKYQGAVVAIDPRDGSVRAMVGGRNYDESQLNRTVTEIRQPGSAFKPFVYAVGLNQGLTANSIVIDEPINISGYSPQNYDKKYRGPITLKKALRGSVNVAAVKLGQQVGIDQVLNLAQSMGISTLVPQDNNLATSLGGLTNGVSLLELSAAYTAFANGGILSRPYTVMRVLDENDRVLEENYPTQVTVLKPETAYIMTDMMRGVIETGTGYTAAIGREAAGKTGTTDNYETAWFIGYIPELLVGIYIGNDSRQPVGISGTEVATLWGSMMKSLTPGIPATEFVVPPGVVKGVPVCATSGKRPTSSCPEVEYSSFLKGTEPSVIDTGNRSWKDKKQEDQDYQSEDQPRNTKPRWKFPIRLPGF